MQGETNLKAEVKTVEIPEFYIAYIHHIGPFTGDSTLHSRLLEKLTKWAGLRRLLNSPETKILSAYNNDPNKVEVRLGISVPENTSVDGEIKKMKIPGGKYAVARFETSREQYGDAWDAVFDNWLPKSGYQHADGFSYELYLNNPEEHPEKKHIYDIVVPVKPL